MYRIYFWIDGESFDAAGFQSGLREGQKGVLRTRKRMNGGIVEGYGTYWCSAELENVGDDMVEALIGLLESFGDELQNAKALGATRVMAEIVYEVKSMDDLTGMYFSVEALKKLAEMEVSLDVDIVRDLGKDALTL